MVAEWCAMTFYRWNKEAGQRVEFPVRVEFAGGRRPEFSGGRIPGG